MARLGTETSGRRTAGVVARGAIVVAVDPEMATAQARGPRRRIEWQRRRSIVSSEIGSMLREASGLVAAAGGRIPRVTGALMGATPGIGEGTAAQVGAVVWGVAIRVVGMWRIRAERAGTRRSHSGEP